MNWDEYEPEGDPRILVARRKSTRKIEAWRLNVHEDAFEALKEIADRAVNRVRERTAREYAPFGELEEDEYFSIAPLDIPEHPGDGRLTDPEPRPASALEMVQVTDQHPVLNPEDLAEAHLDLYAIVYRDANDYVGFVRKSNPKTSLRKGQRYFEFADTLRFVDKPPDLVMDEDVDVIVAADEIAVMNPYSFRVLFGDVHVATQHVDQHVQDLSDRFAGTAIPMTAQTVTSIGSRCQGSVRFAMRLYYLANERAALLALNDAAALTEDLTLRQLDHLLVDGQFAIGEDDVPDFFDWLEGRFFADSHTGQERRADRFSPRRTV